MNGGASDILAIVEAAYAMDGPLQGWMQRLLDTADAAVGRGLGGFGCIFNANRDGTVDIDYRSAAVRGQPRQMIDTIFGDLAHAPRGWLSAFLQGGGGIARCLMTSEVDPQRTLAYREHLAATGVHDGLNLICVDLDQRGVLLSLGVPACAPIGATTRASLARVATHIVTALRLRARLGAACPAMLSPDGEVLPVERDATLDGARRALRDSVRAITRARTALRADPRRALGMWTGLEAAQLTLIDQFDSDGTRYVVAWENPPCAGSFARLTPTERCVVTYAARGSSTKEIAYTLGIRDATVRVLLMRAARRCGVTGREALLALGRRVLDGVDWSIDGVA